MIIGREGEASVDNLGLSEVSEKAADANLKGG